MKKLLALCLIMIFIFVSCTSDKLPGRDPDVIGLIYKIENERILVVSDIESVDITYDEWFEAGKYAAFFSIDKDTTIIKNEKVVDFSSLEKGQKVEVWHTGILAESYPMQGKAVYINILD